MLKPHREIILFFSDTNKNHNFILWTEGGNVENYNGGVYSDHWVLEV
jgi:hypothetical protein